MTNKEKPVKVDPLKISQILDGKFGIVDGRLTKLSNGEVLPLDEPLIVMRARDVYAIPALEYYAKLHDFPGDDWSREKIGEVISKFKAFAQEHPERMKFPGVTRGA